MMRYSSALLLALLAVAVPSQTNADCTDAQINNGDDIIGIICDPDEDDRFGTLCDLLRETNLDNFSRDGDFFLFAPNNIAFDRAGRTAGVTRAQKISTLNYHISNDGSDLTCGTERGSRLTVGGRQQTSITQCDDNGVLLGQEGNVNLPQLGSTAIPQFVSTTFIDACNGQIAELGDVMGWGAPQYNYGVAVLGAPCSFYSKSCKAGKAGAGIVVVSNPSQEGSLVFDDVYYRPRGRAGRWSNLNRWQSVYAVNAPGIFGPNYFAPYYRGKKHKGGKGYGYRQRYYGPRASNYYLGGYYAPPRRGRRGYWYRRELDADEAGEVEGNLRGAHRYSDYEPVEEEPEEYLHYDMEYESEDE